VRTRSTSTVTAVAAVALLGVTLAGRAVQGAGPVPGSVWGAVPGPNRSLSANSLHAVASLDANTAWAVGNWMDDTTGVLRTLTMRWDGTAWQAVESPNTTSAHNTLLGVDGSSPAQLWAVGYSAGVVDDPGAGTLLLLKGDGASWSVVPVTPPGAFSALAAVHMVTEKDGWAVGSYQATPSDPSRGLIMHWNGTAWQQVAAPDLGVPAYRLTAVSGSGSSDAWAVGTAKAVDGTEQPVVLHWTGLSWTRVATPDLGTAGAALFGVAAGSPGEAWVVGRQRVPGTTGASADTHGLALHWTGRAWQVVPGLDAPGYEPRSVTALGTGVWVAGYAEFSSGDVSFVASFDGTKFVADILPIPLPSFSNQNVTGTALSAIAGTPTTGALWAVGWLSGPPCNPCQGRATRLLARGPNVVTAVHR
jgi:hypothetical protein